jgi:Zn-dependent protease with chaperone function
MEDLGQLMTSKALYVAAAAGQSIISTSVWLLSLIGVMALGFVAYLLYRWVDIKQYGFIGEAKQPGDLEKITSEIFEAKRKRKRRRTFGHIIKGTMTWGIQALYIFPGMFFLVVFLQQKEISDGFIYNALMVVTFLVNMLLSKMFAVWAPSRPYACRAYKHESIWRPGNMAWQAWGILSWAVPTYFFYSMYGAQGWVGSVIFMTLSQIVQLIFFIYQLKQKAIPYQEYEGLSDTFKSNLQAYLKTQGIDDKEVGVMQGMGVGPNAFATSITGWYRQIVMTEELIKGFQDPTNPAFTMKLGEDTLESIVAHEVGHVKHHHVEKSMFFGVFFSAVVTIAVYTIFSHITPKDLTTIFGYIAPAGWQFKADTTQQLMLYWGQSMFNIMLTYPLTFIMLGITRGNEYQADTHLLETNGCKNGQDFFHQIRHIAPVPNLPLWVKCNHTHPDAHDRETRMIEWSDKHCKH